MFGIAVWDASRRRAVLARDRLGIKPLYYAVAAICLSSARSSRACLRAASSDELDYEAIDAYLTLGFVPGPGRRLRAVTKLLPGDGSSSPTATSSM